MPAKPARPKINSPDVRATSHTRERAELQRLALDFIVHELGNAASPILMIAELIDRDGTGATSTRSARSLRQTAANLREIAAAIRYFRADPGSESLMPAAFSDTKTWWLRLAPLFGACLPRSARLSEEITAVTADDHTLASLTWSTLGILRLISCALPNVSDVSVSCSAGADASVSIRISVAGARKAELTTDGKRWRRFISAEARAAGARFIVAETPTHTSFEVIL